MPEVEMSSSNKFLIISKSLIILLLLFFSSTITACSLNASEKPKERPLNLPSKNIGKLVNIGEMPFARTNHIAVKLKDGRVLIFGGGSIDENGKCCEYTKTVQMFDPASNQFSMAGQFQQLDSKTYNLKSVLLKNGKVLVMGSTTAHDKGAPYIKFITEIYDPLTKKSYPGPSIVKPRLSFELISLDDGTAIVFGGFSKTTHSNEMDNTFEIYHTDTNTFELKTLPEPFPDYQSVFISNENKIYFPSWDKDTEVKTKIYSTSDNFHKLKDIGELSYNHGVIQGTFVENSRLVIAGTHRTGPRPNDPYFRNKLEVINIQTKKNMGVMEYESKNRWLFTLTPFNNRHVLLAGGRGMKDRTTSDIAQVCDIIQLQCYQPVHMPSPRENHTATLLDDGSILILGGINKALPLKVDKNHLVVNGRHYDRVRNQSEIVSEVLRFYPTEK